MRMNTKPILIQVRIPTECALDSSSFEAEYRADHVVDCVELGNNDTREMQARCEETHGADGPVRFFLAAHLGSCMHMDSTIELAIGRVVDRSYRTPESYPSRVFLQPEAKRLTFCHQWNMSDSAGACQTSVFRGRVSFVSQAPIACSTVSALPNGNDLAVIGGASTGRRSTCLYWQKQFVLCRLAIMLP